MDFRILGPLEVLDEDRVVTPKGGRQRALLALLLLHANETLTTDALIERLWGERAPVTAANTVHAHVSRLRKQLRGREGDGDAVIITRGVGYELRADPETIDARRFVRLLEEGRRELAARRPVRALVPLEAALGLWRGPPLMDLAYEEFVQVEIARLNDLRVAALEDLIDAKLALARHAEVAGELEPLIADHPYRERLRAQLMLALYRSDRQADALQAYQDARRHLVEQLGIEPGGRLRELEQAILAQDPALAIAADGGEPPEPSAAAPHGVFVGRERELGQLFAGLDDAFAGHGRLFLLMGEPGIGKTRLAEELAEHARAREAHVLVGRCWEAGGAPAYWPWVQSLRGYVHDSEATALRSQLGSDGPALVQLLPELRDRLPDLPEPPSLESEGARFRLFEATGSFLHTAGQSRPLVLWLDDMHAADEPSLLLLRFVAREIGRARLLIVCALRDVDPTMAPPVAAALAELVREPSATQIELSGLRPHDVAEYLRQSSGTDPAPQLVSAIQTQTEGNPLFVAELVKLLNAEGRIAEADISLRIPPGVRAVIGRRLGRLSERCRELLAAAGVMGREFRFEALAQISRAPLDQLLEALDEAMTEAVVTEVTGSPGHLRFGHALIRDTLYDELTPARRLQLHQQAGEALEAVYVADIDSHLAELAHHFLAAVPAVSAEKAVDYARRAGNRAASQLAYEEAARLYKSALPIVDEPLARCELLLALGDVQGRAGDTPASKRAFREASDLAEKSDLVRQLARAALGFGGRLMWDASRDDDSVVPLLERALARLGDQDDALRVRLLARLAGGPLRDARFPPERRAMLSREALELARRVGDGATLAHAIRGYIEAHHAPDHTFRQLELARELVTLAGSAGDKERVVDGHEVSVCSLIELGDMRAAKEELAAMTEIADELRQPSHQWFVGVYRALMALLEGRFQAAEELIPRVRAIGQRAQTWNAEVTYRLQLYLLHRARGTLEEIHELLGASADEYPSYPICRCVLASAEAASGHLNEARVELEALTKDGSVSLPFDEEWLVGVGLLAETAATLPDVERASWLYDLLRPYPGRVAICYPEISTGSVARPLGILATTTRSWGEAELHFERALETNARIGARPWLAETQDDYARMLLTRSDAGDRERALELLESALTTYRDLGMETHAVRTSRLIASAR